jgi:hypothetical protein
MASARRLAPAPGRGRSTPPGRRAAIAVGAGRRGWRAGRRARRDRFPRAGRSRIPARETPGLSLDNAFALRRALGAPSLRACPTWPAIRLHVLHAGCLVCGTRLLSPGAAVPAALPPSRRKPRGESPGRRQVSRAGRAFGLCTRVRSTPTSTGLTSSGYRPNRLGSAQNEAYLADLEDEISEYRAAFAGAAVTEIAVAGASCRDG